MENFPFRQVEQLLLLLHERQQ